MNSSLKKFRTQLVILSLILLGINLALSYILPSAYLSKSWPLILAFFFAISFLVHRFLLKRSSEAQGRFINGFMMTTSVKLLLYLFIILIYVLLNRDDAVAFIFTFFAHYLVYTIFEIRSILIFLRKK